MRKLSPVSFMKVKIDDSFWKPRMETNRTLTLPIEYEFNRKNGVLEAYQWDWDPSKAVQPWRPWMGDIGKWIEAAAYSLGSHPNPSFAETVASVVQAVLKGQKEDGYLYSYPVAPGKRWTNLRDMHELYDVGHLMEAAVAYYEATGSRQFLNAMCRCADLLDANFGSEEGKKRGYDGHEEIELALVKLYRATNERRYLNLAKFFIDERGRQPYYFDLEAMARGEDPKLSWHYRWEMPYMCLQAHQPVRDQQDAVGHAVRAMYLYCGMADVAAETGDRELLEACRRLWRSVTHRRMYITGAIGSSGYGEAFTFDYDLPNETAHAETCANIGLVFFAHRMLQIEAGGEYADVMERVLYNGVLSGISFDGRRFFYTNPLAAYPKASKALSGHPSVTRQEWFSCACCPPNIARIIAGIGQFIYSTAEDAVYVHLYVGGSTEVQVGRILVLLRQETDYPWKERVTITVEPGSPARFTVALRMPGWCRGAKVKVNGEAVNAKAIAKKGYARIHRVWEKGDRIELTLPMPVERVEAHPAVRMDCGRVALQRGPIVYCLEEADNGPDLNDIVLPRTASLRVEWDEKLFGGVPVITGKALRRDASVWKHRLYWPVNSRRKSMMIKAIPYAFWANREGGEMILWIKQI